MAFCGLNNLANRMQNHMHMQIKNNFMLLAFSGTSETFSLDGGFHSLLAVYIYRVDNRLHSVK